MRRRHTVSALRWARSGTMVLLAAALLALGGCATQVVNDVSVYHEWPGDIVKPSYVLVREPHQRDSLRHAAFERVVRSELNRAGFSESASARFEISFDFVTGRLLRRVFEEAPFGGAYFWRSYGVPIYPWRYGGTLELFDVRARMAHDDMVYERALRLEIRDREAKPPRLVFEASAVNDGPKEDALDGLRYLMQAVLAEFPGRSGKMRRIVIEVPRPAD